MVFKQNLECPLGHVIHETTVQINDRVRDRTDPLENSGIIRQETKIHCSPSTVYSRLVFAATKYTPALQARFFALKTKVRR